MDAQPTMTNSSRCRLISFVTALVVLASGGAITVLVVVFGGDRGGSDDPSASTSPRGTTRDATQFDETSTDLPGTGEGVDLTAGNAGSTNSMRRAAFPISRPNELVTLTKVTKDLDAISGEVAVTSVIPVGRSYDGNDWETAAGEFATRTLAGRDWHCDDSTCRIDLPHLRDGGPDGAGGGFNSSNVATTNEQYVLTSYGNYSLSDRDVVARFLEMTTFGTTPTDLDDWDYDHDGGGSMNVSTASMAAWVKHQMEGVKPSSHREYWRIRANPRWLSPRRVGRPDHPCDSNSRWRRYAIIPDDTTAPPTYLDVIPIVQGEGGVNVEGPPAYKLVINGELRTVIRDEIRFSSGGGDDPTASSMANGDDVVKSPVRRYEICNSDPPSKKYPRGRMSLRAVNNRNGKCTDVDESMGNPRVDFTGYEFLLSDPRGADSAAHANDVDPSSHRAYVLPLDPDDLVEIGEEITTYPVSPGEDLLLLRGLEDESCPSIPGATNTGGSGNSPIVLGVLPDGRTWLRHDPRLVLASNTVESPLPDGGGQTSLDTAGVTVCANAPRTFLNEDHCFLSANDDAVSCGPSPPSTAELTLDDATIMAFNRLTRRYVYAVDGLPVRDDFGNEVGHPCEPGRRSRWERSDSDDERCDGDDGDGSAQPGPRTILALTKLLEESTDTNPFIRDVVFPNTADADDGGTGYAFGCDDSDTDPIISIRVGDDCWTHVHPEHMSVFDVTTWARNKNKGHPGNEIAKSSGRPNPIRKWADVEGSAILVYPSGHPLDPTFDHGLERWDAATSEKRLLKLGRYGDRIWYRDLPGFLRGDSVAEHFSAMPSIRGTSGIPICGSPGEVANDPTVGSAFDVTADPKEDPSLGGRLRLRNQREVVWTSVVLSAPDQLRQRVAWALSQILAVETDAIETSVRNTEIFLNFYDIFVRNAFGNYRDILREISYSPLMAENLSFFKSKSSAYLWDRERIVAFADENFAREIMQLFSTGLVQLTIDGTPRLDSDGNTIQVYTNADIMSFARAWTGFDGQQGRGNTEDYKGDDDNKLDPMRVEAEWRDRFPKTDLSGGYIGDGYPLCVDLPPLPFLRKGARYRLLGSSGLPELMKEDPAYRDDPTIKRFVLDEGSQLRNELMCRQQKDNGGGRKDSGGGCVYSNNVLLSSDLKCSGLECDVDTIRVVQVTPEIFYEYVRQPCVELAFFDSPVKITRHGKLSSGNMCGNPLLPVASEACCPDPLPEGYTNAVGNHIYDGERMTFNRAERRCKSTSRRSCDYDGIEKGMFYKGHNKIDGYHWAVEPCTILAKIDAGGDVAIVYEMTTPVSKVSHVAAGDTRNFFPVLWTVDDNHQGTYPNGRDNACDGGKCDVLEDGGCLCKTTVVESAVFTSIPTNVERVLASLHVGAVDPSSDAAYSPSTLNGTGIVAHTLGGAFDTNTIFEVTDGKSGRTHFFKNVRSDVHLRGMDDEETPYAFRNTPHFMSLIPTETDARDAMYETEAVLDVYMYHENTAPFLALRLIQRFGISNPSPRYIRVVATAFRDGMYRFSNGSGGGGQTYGTGNRGDLAATIAAILLDREARTPILDADPSHGSLREPILKVLAFMRNLEFTPEPEYPSVTLFDMDQGIGQMAHEIPSVFSFFLPEYVPDGRMSSSMLVSPEAMTYNMPNIVGLVNGLFSMVKYGLAGCKGGFGKNDALGVCRDNGSYERARGTLKYQPSPATDAEVIVDELATLLTSGRLSPTNRRIISEAYIEKLSSRKSDAGSAFRLAVQLMATSPEFHSTNLVKKNGVPRKQRDTTTPSGNGNAPVPYKALVFLMFSGGCDSFNMLVPHTCSRPGNGVDMATQYREVRQQVALTSGLHEISATNQTCEKFGVHPNLPILQKLYNENAALFFANTGVLTRPINKENYMEGAPESQLFAHNTMQMETRRLDPFAEIRGTGVMGRIRDVLSRNNIRANAACIDTNSDSDAVVGRPGVSPPHSIIKKKGVDEFNPNPSAADMSSRIADINNATHADSGFFAETWSSKLLTSLDQNEDLFKILSSATTKTTFPDTKLGDRLKVLAQMIQTHPERKSDRDLFFVQVGKFDTHAKVVDRLAERFTEVNDALVAFVSELKHLGLWKNVAVIQASEFGRTLTPNGGDGTDHAWGGNYFLLGGSVRGGKVLGEYPDDITDSSPLRLKRGRLCPTTSWDMVWNGLAQWMGVDSKADLDDVCPSRNNFPTEKLFNATDLFNEDNREWERRKRRRIRKSPIDL